MAGYFFSTRYLKMTLTHDSWCSLARIMIDADETQGIDVSEASAVNTPSLPPPGTEARVRKVEIWHNILWSRYKGEVFSSLYRIAGSRNMDAGFVQMAETERLRVNLGQIDLASHRYPFELLFSGVIEDVPKYRIVPLCFWRGLTSKADFVIIASYSYAENWAHLLGLMLSGTRRGVFCDSTALDRPQSPFRKVLKRIFFRRCDRIFCYGERSRQYVLSFGVDPERVVTPCQAAALPATYAVDAVEQRRASRPAADPRILYVGRLALEKNLVRLIEAFSAYAARSPAATLRLVGSGPEDADLKRLVAARGLDRKVIFVGTLGPEQLALEYYAASFLALPSLSEPWGLVVNEALAHGCPVLASDRCGCVPELVVPGTGLTFDPLDTAELGDRMVQMESLSVDRAATARNCLACIAQFTPDAAATQMIRGLESALAAAPSRP